MVKDGPQKRACGPQIVIVVQNLGFVFKDTQTVT